ncbi:hypothetical protein [Candidatus Phyllobacterium onerii]|uniref:hypothetical protein n=1 Tax=Candidatus Phyllobacterium onerii TaxID=3020828 RepID=UPI0023305E08|nr:hypothetical protein [Phyllobacterium sp. IY22]
MPTTPRQLPELGFLDGGFVAPHADFRFRATTPENVPPLSAPIGAPHALLKENGKPEAERHYVTEARMASGSRIENGLRTERQMPVARKEELHRSAPMPVKNRTEPKEKPPIGGVLPPEFFHWRHYAIFKAQIENMISGHI